MLLHAFADLHVTVSGRDLVLTLDSSSDEVVFHGQRLCPGRGKPRVHDPTKTISEIYHTV